MKYIFIAWNTDLRLVKNGEIDYIKITLRKNTPQNLKLCRSYTGNETLGSIHSVEIEEEV
jgi:hypothetical protein